MVISLVFQSKAYYIVLSVCSLLKSVCILITTKAFWCLFFVNQYWTIFHCNWRCRVLWNWPMWHVDQILVFPSSNATRTAPHCGLDVCWRQMWNILQTTGLAQSLVLLFNPLNQCWTVFVSGTVDGRWRFNAIITAKFTNLWMEIRLNECIFLCLYIALPYNDAKYQPRMERLANHVPI